MKNFSSGKRFENVGNMGFKRSRIEEAITNFFMFLCHGPWMRLKCSSEYPVFPASDCFFNRHFVGLLVFVIEPLQWLTTHNKGTRKKTRKYKYIYILRQIRAHDLRFATTKNKPLLRPRNHWHQRLRNLILELLPTTQNRIISRSYDSNRTSAQFKPSSSLCYSWNSEHTQRFHNYGFENPWSRHIISWSRRLLKHAPILCSALRMLQILLDSIWNWRFLQAITIHHIKNWSVRKIKGPQPRRMPQLQTQLTLLRHRS
jgi:hypothetical protein